MTSRRPVLTRTDPTENLVLQERDIGIIIAIWAYQGLTSCQLQRLFSFGTATRANSRLRRLFDHQFSQRVRVATARGGSLLVYVPGEAAVPVIAGDTGREPSAIRRIISAEARASSLLRGHDLAVADLRIAVTQSIAQRSTLHLLQWLNARDSYHRFGEHAVRPDGFLQIQKDEVITSVFLELDRGTVDLPRFQDKCRRYTLYRDTGAFANRYGLERFRVAVTAPTRGRLERLMAATRAIAPRGWWFALTDEVTAHGDLTRPVWHSLSTDQPRPLIDLEE